MRESTPFVVVEIVDGVAEIAEFLVESARAFVEEIATRESTARGGGVRRAGDAFGGSRERRDALARRLEIGAERIDDGIDGEDGRRRDGRRVVHRQTSRGGSNLVPFLEGRVDGFGFWRWRGSSTFASFALSTFARTSSIVARRVFVSSSCSRGRRRGRIRGARECVSRDDANRGATGSRRAGEYGGEDVPSLGSRDDVHGVLAAGVRRLGVGAARADEPRHHGPVLVPRGDVQRCVAARVPGARGDARVLVGMLEDEANGREVSARRRREQRGERRGSLLRRGGHRARQD